MRMRALGATLVRPEGRQRRLVFDLPIQVGQANKQWLRIRDEGDKTTLSLKAFERNAITGQKELLLVIDSFDNASALLESLGCKRRSYQESKRESWKLGEIDLSIDTWPFLEPYIEIEGPSEGTVRNTAAQLGLSYGEAVFGPVSTIYRLRYGKTLEELDASILEHFTFDIVNPFTGA